jgi:hypothetical protein
MAKMSITKAFSKRLRIEAASRRLRIIAEVVLGTFIGDSQIVTDTASISDLVAALLGKLFSDAVGTTDQAIFVIGKGAQDSVQITETTAFDVSKPLTDAYIASDIASVGAGKVVSDSFSMTDNQISSIGKNPQDAILLAESQSFDVSKAVSDIAITVEVLGVTLSKTFTDSVSMTDSVSSLLLTLEEAFDAGSVTDTNTLTFGKQPIDTTITSDSQVFAISKSLNDTVYVTDDIGAEATIDDDQTLQFQKRVINFASMTDAVTLTTEYDRSFSDSLSMTDSIVVEAAYLRPQSDSASVSDNVSLIAEYARSVSDTASTQDNQASLVGKVESDTLGIADSGVLLSQDYVDNNLYFADDYVGEKRIF